MPLAFTQEDFLSSLSNQMYTGRMVTNECCGQPVLGLIFGRGMAMTGWPRHRENREFGSFSRQGKHREFAKKY